MPVTFCCCMGEDRGYPIDSQGGSFYVWEKNRNTVINGNDPDRVTVYLLWLYMHRLVMRLNMHRKHRQQVCRALQSLLRRAPVEAKLFTGCTPMETCRIQGKGEVKVTDDFSYRSAMIKTVTVASGITGIGDRTFSGCRNY